MEINEQMYVDDVVLFHLKCVTMKEIPDLITLLSNLEVLNISHNRIERLPDSLGDLSNLCDLNVSYNKLEHLPDSIIELDKLKILNCGNNKLKELPYGFEILKLEKLDISNNKLKYLNESFSELRYLKELDLQNNLFDSLPGSVYNLECLKILQCSKKGMKMPQPEFRSLEILRRNNNDSRERYTTLYNNKKVKYHCYKIYRHIKTQNSC